MTIKNFARHLLSVVAVSLSLVSISKAAAIGSVGVNFTGGGNGGSPAVSMASGDVAGVVPQANFNNVAGSGGTNLSLVDNLGNSTNMKLTYTAGGTYSVYGGTSVTPNGGDQELNSGFIYGSATVTVSNIPYERYSVYVYELNDASGREEQTWLNGDMSNSVYGTAPNPTDSGHVDGTVHAYTYTQSTGTLGSPTTGGDYVLFANVFGSSVTFNDSAPGNGYITGFEIVNTSTPEPGTVVSLVGLVGTGLVGLVIRRRRANRATN